VSVIFVFAAALLCTILPSQVAFTSLVSAGGVPTIAAYGLIALLRLTQTPHDFQGSHFRLGTLARPFYASAAFFNAIVFAVGLVPFACGAFAECTVYAGHDLPVLLPCDRGDLQFRESYSCVDVCVMRLSAFTGPGDLRRCDDLRSRQLVLYAGG
jgi:hypothetical protein